ncbi:MAG: YerC/YecD family TrpR-related protein [Firmicutes bacterium]|nr:YerC/YecD family TrpR-related protein [Bacillota bacterium]
MNSDHIAENKNQFYEAILALQTPEECDAFFEDVCTIKEIMDLSARLQVAKMLDEGTIFSEISKQTGASSATISRVNKCLRFGPGGYRLILDRLKDKEA